MSGMMDEEQKRKQEKKDIISELQFIRDELFNKKWLKGYKLQGSAGVQYVAASGSVEKAFRDEKINQLKNLSLGELRELRENTLKEIKESFSFSLSKDSTVLTIHSKDEKVKKEEEITIIAEENSKNKSKKEGREKEYTISGLQKAISNGRVTIDFVEAKEIRESVEIRKQLGWVRDHILTVKFKESSLSGFGRFSVLNSWLQNEKLQELNKIQLENLRRKALELLNEKLYFSRGSSNSPINVEGWGDDENLGLSERNGMASRPKKFDEDTLKYLANSEKDFGAGTAGVEAETQIIPWKLSDKVTDLDFGIMAIGFALGWIGLFAFGFTLFVGNPVTGAAAAFYTAGFVLSAVVEVAALAFPLLKAVAQNVFNIINNLLFDRELNKSVIEAPSKAPDVEVELSQNVVPEGPEKSSAPKERPRSPSILISSDAPGSHVPVSPDKEGAAASKAKNGDKADKPKR